MSVFSGVLVNYTERRPDDPLVDMAIEALEAMGADARHLLPRHRRLSEGDHPLASRIRHAMRSIER